MIEVEIKTRISNDTLNINDPVCRELCAKIEELGFSGWKAQRITDTYYDSPDDCLGGRGLSLRVRDYKYGDSGSYLCFKGQKLIGKSREEVDVQVGPGIHKVLENLGYKSTAILNKRRWKYAGDDVELCIDSVEGLGTFLEIEAMSQPERMGEELLRITRMMYKLGYVNLIDDSYLEMTLGRR